MKFAMVVSAAAALAGCGYIGDTKPPTLEIPSRIVDLRAVEYGVKILVEFTLPPLTTEGLALTNVKSVELRVTADGAATRDLNVPPKDPGAFSYDFAAQEWIGKQVTLTVRATGSKGKASDWSNPVTLAVGIPLAAPTGLAARNAPGGVLLTWDGAGPGYRIFRASGNQTPARLGDSDKVEYLDMGAAYGTAYRYLVQAIDGETRWSEVSGEIAFTPKDESAPGVPSGVSAVAGVNAIELAWQRNTEDDFAGYNVYRSVEGGAFQKLAGPIEAPTYSDRQVETGKRYRYSVSSMDTAGNESDRSPIAEVTAQ